MINNSRFRIMIAVVGFAAYFTFCSCDKEIKEIKNLKGNGGEITITASVEQPSEMQSNNQSTKTTLTSDGTAVLWNNNDQIVVFAYIGEIKGIPTFETTGAIFTAGESGASVPFTGTLASGTAPLIAYYPASNVISQADGGLWVFIPFVKTYKANSFGEGANPAVGYSTDGSTMNFKNICGVVKISLTGSGTVKQIGLSSPNIIAGIGVVNPLEENPKIYMSDRGSTEVVLDCGPSGVTLSGTATDFYIAVPPASDNAQFGITVLFSDGSSYSKVAPATTNNKFVRSKIIKMPLVDPVSAGWETNVYVEQGINQGKGKSVGSFTWAPVNCGYNATDFKYGKMYQWGNKYGLAYNYPYGDSGTEDNKTNNYSGENISPFITNYKRIIPTVFYSNWPKRSEINGWWGTASPYWNTKNLEHDPCPTGWRIPTAAAFLDLISKALPIDDTTGPNYFLDYYADISDLMHGRWFGTGTKRSSLNLFLPAAGNDQGRSDYDASGRGYYWSATPGDDATTPAKYLFFEANTVAVRSVSIPENAVCSIRCLKE